MKTKHNPNIESDDLWSCLIKGSHDGIIVSSRDQTIISCNEAAAKLIALSESELIGQPLTSVVEIEGWEQQAPNNTRQEEIHNTTPSGVGVDESKFQPQNTGASYSFSRSAATILCRTGLNLTMPVDHLTITDQSDEILGYLTVIHIVQASSVQQAQTEFVSTVSHELRTPLTSIKGFADTILRAGDRIDPNQQKRYLGIIKDQADRLTRLVEDLLAVSRLESKKMQLTMRAIDFEETLQRVIRNLSDKARNHRIVCHLSAGLPPVWADADRLEQVLTNLIDNAIKYSLPQSTVSITARDIDTHPEMVEFAITDQGVGIPAEQVPQIFAKFSRLDNPLVRQTEGTGLGLYITKSLVLALGGDIRVESFPGKTTFTVRLPATSLEAQAARGRD